jgi:hypothetical protein
VLSGERTFQPVKHDLETLEVEVIDTEEPNFTRSQSMTVGDEEDRLVTLVRDA